MKKKYFIIVGAMLLLASIFFVTTYQDNKNIEDVKFCDSINIKSDYDGEPICYEKPITYLNKKTKLVRINNNG